jgi:hypothetical protein
MANTPPPPPISERPTERLLDELCVELRHVAVCDSSLPAGERVVTHIKQVCAIHHELTARQISLKARLSELSSQTNWQMNLLLDDCLAFPSKTPYVREQDGIRRTLRCRMCKRAERPPDAKIFWMCNDCLAATIEAMRTRKPIPGLILLRSYNPECRCEHADSETVLAADSYYIEQLWGVCEKCVEIELKRRHANPPVGL